MSDEPEGLWERGLQFVQHDVWHPLETARRGVAFGQRMLQALVAVAEGFNQNLILLRASALTYYSVLSLVPLLAIAAAVASAFGIQDLLPTLLEPFAQISPEGAEWIIGFVTRFDFGSLGTIGAVMLLGTTVFGIHSIESALNAVWGVDRGRPWERRLPDYLAVLIVAPLLLGVALSLGTTLSQPGLVERLTVVPGFKSVYTTGLRAAPLVFYALGFSFLFWFMPNTRVRIRSAAVGGVITALLFVLTNKFYVDLQIGVARANALFAGLAAFPITIVWIYVSWILVLFGAECAFVNQNLDNMRRARRGTDPRPAAREAIGLAVATEVACAFARDGASIAPAGIASELDLSERIIRLVLNDLEKAGIVALRGDAKESQFQLGRAPDAIRVEDVLEALRGRRTPIARLGFARGVVMGVLNEMDEKAAASLAGRTLTELAAEAEERRAREAAADSQGGAPESRPTLGESPGSVPARARDQ